LGNFGIKRHTTCGHGAYTAKVLAHDEKRVFAVFDGIFRLGKLGLRCVRKGGSGTSQAEYNEQFHKNS
jgi:hypothetical protein